MDEVQENTAVLKHWTLMAVIKQQPDSGYPTARGEYTAPSVYFIRMEHSITVKKEDLERTLPPSKSMLVSCQDGCRLFQTVVGSWTYPVISAGQASERTNATFALRKAISDHFAGSKALFEQHGWKYEGLSKIDYTEEFSVLTNGLVPQGFEITKRAEGFATN